MSSVVISGDTSGSVTLQAPSVAGSTVLTLPTSNGTVVVTGGAQTIEFADGSAAAPSITNSGDTNTGMFFPAADTVAFTEGGTERLRITPNGAVAFSGASNFGSSGQLLQSNGDAAPSWTTLNTNINLTTFTSSGTWTVPAGVTTALVTVIGGGGNGGSGAITSGGGGGGSGGVASDYVTGLTPGSNVTVTVGGAGGTSSFGAFLSATGGSNGANGSGSTPGNGGAGGVGSGTFGFDGIRGGIASNAGSGSGGGGIGAALMLYPIDQTSGASATTQASRRGMFNSIGGGVSAQGSATPGTAGQLGGGGGGGHGSNNGGSTAGGAGGSGLVLIQY